MKKLLVAMLTLAVSAVAAGAAEYEGLTLEAVQTFPVGRAAAIDPIGIRALAADYSNVTTFSGSALAQGGAALQGANTITRLMMDDLTPNGVNAGADVVQIKFSVYNGNPYPVDARARVRFWFANGAGGNPGAYYNLPGNVGFTFNAFSFAPGVTLLTGTIGANLFKMPGVPFWAGITFDNQDGATGATAAELNLFGQGIFGPATVGSSTDTAFLTTNAGSFFGTANPAGAQFNLNGNPVADFGWEFSVDVPVGVEATHWSGIKSLYR